MFGDQVKLTFPLLLVTNYGIATTNVDGSNLIQVILMPKTVELKLEI